MDYKTITYYGVSLTVKYSTIGKYIPPTHYHPEELPELFIYEICVDDSSVNLYDLFLEDQIEDITLIVQSYL